MEQKEQAELLQSVQEQLDQGHLEQAEKQCLDCLEEEPEWTEALFSMALVKSRQRAHAKAVEWYEKAIQQEEDLRYFEGLGISLIHLERFEEAEETYKKILALAPEKATGFLHHSAILTRLDRMEEAESSVRQAIALEPTLGLAWANLSAILFNRKANQEAIEAAEKAIESEPESVDHRLYLCFLYQKLGKLTDATACLIEALKVHKYSIVMWSELGNLYIEQKQYYEAEDAINNAIEYSGGTDVDLQLDLAVVLIETDRLYEAEHYVRDILRSKPKHRRAMLLLADVCARTLRFGESGYQAGKVLEQKPNNIRAHFYKGQSLRALGQTSESIPHIQEVLKADPHYKRAYMELAAALYLQESPDDAIEQFEAAIHHNPSFDNAHFYLGVLKTLKGEEAQAEQHFQQFQQTDSTRDLAGSWDFIQEHHKDNTQFFSNVFETLTYGLEQSEVEGLVMEFGVSSGNSIRHIAKQVQQTVHGFDSFTGLPEPWKDHAAGMFTLYGKKPTVPENVDLHVGLFSDVLPVFLFEQAGPVRFLHVDCDLYSSTYTIFRLLGESLCTGSIVVIDEYLLKSSWKTSEHLAFEENMKTQGLQFEYLAFNVFTGQVVIRIL